jgi:FtsH-binding integral membrane protein
MADEILPPAPAIAIEPEVKKDVEYDVRMIVYNIASESLFIILPFIVIAIALASRGRLQLLFTLPEFSIVSAVIVGQTIVRCISVLLGRQLPNRPGSNAPAKEGFVLLVTCLLVLLLVPTLILLTLVLTNDALSLTLQIAQIALFLLSLFAFAFGSTMESMVHTKDHWKR